MVQYGFFFDQSRCISCHTCTVACRDWNDIDPGPVKWLRMFEWERGAFPIVTIHTLFAPCYHCENPVCVKACPNGALFKEEKYGAVLVDKDKCKGTRKCWLACPYGAPQFANDESGTPMSKCTMCIDRLEKGMKPVCVESCPTRAFDFDTMENIEAKYGTLRKLEEMPRSVTNPAIVFKPHAEKRQLVPYDVDRALGLFAGRDSLPPVYNSKTDVTEIAENLVGRNKLILKPRTAEDLLRQTRNDEG